MHKDDKTELGFTVKEPTERYEIPKGKEYKGSKWGEYLRAPAVFWKILEKAGSLLVPFKKIADVKPGCYSGLNDFFYIRENRVQEGNIETKFLTPIISDTKMIEKLYLEPTLIKERVFSCHLPKHKLKSEGYEGALKYISWGEKQVTRKRQKVGAGIPWPKTETVKNRKPGWWSIPKQNLIPTNLFMLYVISDRFLCPYTKDAILSDRCFHRVFVKNPVDTIIMASILNSTIWYLFITLSGRCNLGQGAMKFETNDAKKMLVINPQKIDPINRKTLKQCLLEIQQREILTIYNEVQMEDRRKLDSIILNILGFKTPYERKNIIRDLYNGINRLTRMRLEKAKTIMGEEE